MSVKYDRVYYWKGGKWNEAFPCVYPDYTKTVEILVAELETAGYPAVPGLVAVGPPDTEPSRTWLDTLHGHPGRSRMVLHR